jgi:Spy/CpxP family protein refolding chaperone
VALVAAALMTGLGIGAWALQGPEGPGAGAPGFPVIQQLIRQLNLTEEQKTEVRNFLEDARSQAQVVQRDTSLTRGQKIDRIDEIQQQTQQKIHSILTTEQQMQLEDLRKQTQERFDARRDQMEDRLLQQGVMRLNLTDAQQTTIQSYLDEQKTQINALRDNTSLSREERVSQARAIRRQTAEKVRSTLTAEQQQQLEEMRQNAGNRRRRGPGPGRGLHPGGPVGPGDASLSL